MMLFSRWTAAGRGKRDGLFWRITHEVTETPFWEGKELIEQAKEYAHQDYVSHTWSDTRYHLGYIKEFILAYTATQVICEPSRGKVKDISIEELLAAHVNET